MYKKSKLVFFTSHFFFLGAGVAIGSYVMPILTAEDNATAYDVSVTRAAAKYTATFSRDQPGSDALRWAEGQIYLSDMDIAFIGEVAPGPDYKIYLTKRQAYDQTSFLKMKNEAVLIGNLNNFGNFIKALPEGVNPDDFTAVQIWCERFSTFISSARYQ